MKAHSKNESNGRFDTLSRSAIISRLNTATSCIGPTYDVSAQVRDTLSPNLWVSTEERVLRDFR